MRETTVFIPANKGRIKTTARGFWKDNGRTYYDYVFPKVLRFNYAHDKKESIEYLRKKFNQLAMFYTAGGRAYIQSANYKTEVLTRRSSIFVLGKKALRAYVKKFLQAFNGVTVYDIGCGYYELESWTK
jgi:hypothetical protein